MFNRRTFLKTSVLAPVALAVKGGVQRANAASRTNPFEKERLGVRRSDWFRAEGNLQVCTLCPKECRLSPGQRGACRVRENRNGEGVTLVYGRPALVQEDPIERKPFFHVLPGSRSLSVATAGCNMSCKFCQVWDMALVSPEDVHSYDMPPERLVEHALESGVRSVAYTLGEPVAFFEYMVDIARLAQSKGLLNLLHTNGFIQPEPLDALLPMITGVNVDLKGFDADFYRDVCGGELDTVLASLRHIHAKGCHLEVTTVLIPTLNDKDDDIRAMCRWIVKELGTSCPVHFSRFYPLYQLSNLPPTPLERLERAYRIARDEGLEFVYLANVPGHASESTNCPQCAHRLISRLGFVVEKVDMDGDACPQCGFRVKGHWQSS